MEICWCQGGLRKVDYISNRGDSYLNIMSDSEVLVNSQWIDGTVMSTKRREALCPANITLVPVLGYYVNQHDDADTVPKY